MKLHHKIEDIYYYDKFLFLLQTNDVLIYFPTNNHYYNINIWNGDCDPKQQGYIYTKPFPKNIAERLMKNVYLF